MLVGGVLPGGFQEEACLLRHPRRCPGFELDRDDPGFRHVARQTKALAGRDGLPPVLPRRAALLRAGYVDPDAGLGSISDDAHRDRAAYPC